MATIKDLGIYKADNITHVGKGRMDVVITTQDFDKLTADAMVQHYTEAHEQALTGEWPKKAVEA